MRKAFWIAMLFAAIGFVLTGCETMDRREDVTGGAALTDTQLEDRVEEKLNSDAQLKDADLDIDANAAQNQVTLSGDVESQALKERAISLARSAHANLNVIDKIEVKPREVSRAEYTEERAREERERARGRGETIGDTLDDAWIHAKIVAQLIGDPDTPQRDINVDVVNNVVTLRGTVETAEQKAEAERIAKQTDGVKSVKNMLKVGGNAKSGASR